MKTLEREFLIPTQGIRSDTASSIKFKRATLENIINKTNMKLGGLNYSLNYLILRTAERDDSKPLINYLDSGLFIGLATSKYTGTKHALGHDKFRPCILGCSSNTAENQDPFAFVGNFAFFDGCSFESELQAMELLIEESIKRYKRVKNGSPAFVFVYRHGCDEGHYKKALQFEQPLLVKWIKNCEVADPKLTYIVPSKLHSTRLFLDEIIKNKIQRQHLQNIPPGTVLDHGIVHPIFNEFYLCSHLALKGTAKVPRYTVLFDNCGYTNDEFERITFGLAFAYQIVNSPVSLPAPSYIAQHYADRGRMIYDRIAPNSDFLVPIRTDVIMPDGGSLHQGCPTSQNDLDTLFELLSYRDTPLANNRINA